MSSPKQTKMSKKVLITTTSLADTPGAHHDLMKGHCSPQEQCWAVTFAREQLLPLLDGSHDAIVCGDDAWTETAIQKAIGPDPTNRKLRILAKYGIGLDKIDRAAAAKHGVPVGWTPGVNHTTVAEATMGLMLAAQKHLFEHVSSTREGGWKRATTHELAGKTLSVIGMGRIGKEVIKRSRAFDMEVVAFDVFWNDDNEKFAKDYSVTRAATMEEALQKADIVTLHTFLDASTHHMINKNSLAKMKKGVVIVNTSRGEIINSPDLLDGLKSGQVGYYAADVLEAEPPQNDPLTSAPHCIITPHVSSRTYESVQRQATKAITNAILAMDNKLDEACISPPPKA
eukprot:gene4147-4471_t